MPFATAIVNSANRMRSYAERVTKDLGDHNFARLPRWGLGGEAIKCNHPAWVFGHLAIYPPRLLGLLGAKSDGLVPANFSDLFKDGTPCLDDAAGHIYPSREAILNAYFAGTDALIAACGKLTDADLAKPTPDEGMAKHFPTLAEAMIFMLNNHVAMHIGQISTWRRAMGLPPA